MNSFYIIISALTAGAATFLGVFIGVRKNYREKGVAFGSAFAATIMVLISIFELIPAAASTGGWSKATLYILIGAAVLAVANYFIPHLHSVKDIRSCDQRCLAQASYLIVIGMILHDFPEGFAIPGSFDHSASLGLLVFLTSFIHNVPEGYTMTIGSGLSKAFYYRSAALSTLSTTLGAVLGLVLLEVFAGISGLFLAFTAGAMLYISFHELLPIAWRHREKKAMFNGFVVALLIFLLLSFI